MTVDVRSIFAATLFTGLLAPAVASAGGGGPAKDARGGGATAVSADWRTPLLLANHKSFEHPDLGADTSKPVQAWAHYGKVSEAAELGELGRAVKALRGNKPRAALGQLYHWVSYLTSEPAISAGVHRGHLDYVYLGAAVAYMTMSAERKRPLEQDLEALFTLLGDTYVAAVDADVPELDDYLKGRYESVRTDYAVHPKPARLQACGRLLAEFDRIRREVQFDRIDYMDKSELRTQIFDLESKWCFRPLLTGIDEKMSDREAARVIAFVVYHLADPARRTKDPRTDQTSPLLYELYAHLLRAGTDVRAWAVFYVNHYFEARYARLDPKQLASQKAALTTKVGTLTKAEQQLTRRRRLTDEQQKQALQIAKAREQSEAELSEVDDDLRENAGRRSEALAAWGSALVRLYEIEDKHGYPIDAAISLALEFARAKHDLAAMKAERNKEVEHQTRAVTRLRKICNGFAWSHRKEGIYVLENAKSYITLGDYRSLVRAAGADEGTRECLRKLQLAAEKGRGLEHWPRTKNVDWKLTTKKPERIRAKGLGIPTAKVLAEIAAHDRSRERAPGSVLSSKAAEELVTRYRNTDDPERRKALHAAYAELLWANGAVDFDSKDARERTRAVAADMLTGYSSSSLDERVTYVKDADTFLMVWCVDHGDLDVKGGPLVKLAGIAARPSYPAARFMDGQRLICFDVITPRAVLGTRVEVRLSGDKDHTLDLPPEVGTSLRCWGISGRSPSLSCQ